MRIIDVAHWLYYAEFLDLTLHDLEVLFSLSNTAMESIWKEHMTTFHKRLYVCVLNHLDQEHFNKFSSLQYESNSWDDDGEATTSCLLSSELKVFWLN